MNRIESWLRRVYWPVPVMRLGLFLLLCFWVIPGGWLLGELRAAEKKNAAEARQHPYTHQRQIEFNDFVKGRVLRARRLGAKYSAKDYFTDVGDIMRRGQGLGNPWNDISAMQGILLDNKQAGLVSQKEFDYWQQKVTGGPKKAPPIPWVRVFRWLLIAYLKVLPLVLLAYLLRMADRRGVLETALADKRKLVLALFGWPLFFREYPDDVVREVQVEAELRRIGGLFRRLNPVERLKIREIASAANFEERLRALHEAHRPEYQRGLAVAMLATVFCLLILPRVSEARMAKAKMDPHGTVMAMARGPAIQLDLATDHSPTSGDSAVEATFPDTPELLVLGSEPTGVWGEKPPRQSVLRRIDHVPEFPFVSISR